MKKIALFCMLLGMGFSCSGDDIKIPEENPPETGNPPSTEFIYKINIEGNIMAVVGSNNWHLIVYGNGKYVVVGVSGYITTSTDGTNWTTPVQVGSDYWTSVAYGNGKFVAVGDKGYITTSTNGVTWTTPVQISISYFGSIVYGNGKFVAVGNSGYITTSTDGVTWTTPVKLKDESGNEVSKDLYCIIPAV